MEIQQLPSLWPTICCLLFLYVNTFQPKYWFHLNYKFHNSKLLLLFSWTVAFFCLLFSLARQPTHRHRTNYTALLYNTVYLSVSHLKGKSHWLIVITLYSALLVQFADIHSLLPCILLSECKLFIIIKLIWSKYHFHLRNFSDRFAFRFGI